MKTLLFMMFSLAISPVVSLYQVQYVRIQDKFIVQDFVITIYRSKHAGVSYSRGIKPQVHESYQLLRGAIN